MGGHVGWGISFSSSNNPAHVLLTMIWSILEPPETLTSSSSSSQRLECGTVHAVPLYSGSEGAVWYDGDELELPW